MYTGMDNVLRYKQPLNLRIASIKKPSSCNLQDGHAQLAFTTQQLLIKADVNVSSESPWASQLRLSGNVVSPKKNVP